MRYLASEQLEIIKDTALAGSLAAKHSMVEVKQRQLFRGDQLWLRFYIYRAIIMRSALLINWSYEEDTYGDWRQDKGVGQQLRAA